MGRRYCGKEIGATELSGKVGDQTKKVHLLAANSNLTDKNSADDWGNIPLSTTSQDETDSVSNHADNASESRPARYPQQDQRPVKRFKLIEYCT